MMGLPFPPIFVPCRVPSVRLASCFLPVTPVPCYCYLALTKVRSVLGKVCM